MTPCPLTPQQLAAVRVMADDKIAKAAAVELGVAKHTVDRLIGEALKAAGVKKITGLVAKAIREGWIE